MNKFSIALFYIMILLNSNTTTYHTIDPVSPPTNIDISKSRKKYPKRIYLLSYPRTGSNWLGYCIENISNIKTCWASDIPDNPFKTYTKERCSIPLHECSLEAATCKLHSHDKDLFDLLSKPSSSNALILIIRNYKECITRHISTGANNNINNQCISYLRSLELYDSCKTPKILFYYENLMQQPKKELNRLHRFLANFTNIPNKLDNFIHNLDKHKKFSYQKQLTKISEGKVLYHSLKLSFDQKKYYDNIMKKENFDIFKKYLKIYAEN